MKTKHLFPRAFRVISLIFMGGLLVAGFTQMAGAYSISRLQENPLTLEVPVLQQSQSTSCGEAVIVMTYNYVYPESPLTEQEVIQYAAANGYYTAGLPPFTSPANMVKIAKYYAENVSAGAVMNSDQALALLIQKLESGEPVIIDVLTYFDNPDSEAHFVVVTGLSMDPYQENTIIVHYNDPLTGTKETANWAGAEGVWNAWENNGDPGGSGWWMAISPP